MKRSGFGLDPAARRRPGPTWPCSWTLAFPAGGRQGCVLPPVIIAHEFRGVLCTPELPGLLAPRPRSHLHLPLLTLLWRGLGAGGLGPGHRQPPGEEGSCRGRWSHVPAPLPPPGATLSPCLRTRASFTSSGAPSRSQARLQTSARRGGHRRLAYWHLFFSPLKSVLHPEGLRPTFPECSVGSFQGKCLLDARGCSRHLSPERLGGLKIHGKPIVSFILVVKQVGLYY